MEIRKRFSDNIAILYIAGKINLNSAELIEQTGRLLKEGIKKILLSFANVGMVDYNGLSLLAITYKNAINQKGTLKFCDVPKHIKTLFKTARLDRVFEVYADEKTALKCFDVSTRVDQLLLRRRFKRIDISSLVQYKTGLSPTGKFLEGKILNLSGEGLFIYAKKTFPASTEIYMEINVGHKKPLALTGNVIWLADKELQRHSYPGMGIQLSNLDKNAQREIIAFIDKNLTIRSNI